MSRLKKIKIIFLGLIMFLATACNSNPVLLETGEKETETVKKETGIETESDLQKVDSKALIYVYVCGQVTSPGVYELSEGDRIYQAIDKAGGVLPEGDITKLNFAEVLIDGQMIFVPSFEEAETWMETEKTESNVEDGRVNINQASKEMLMTLPGIGESKAEAILAYREENGPFDSLEALMKVPGIKEGIYFKIKDQISIN